MPVISNPGVKWVKLGSADIYNISKAEAHSWKKEERNFSMPKKSPVLCDTTTDSGIINLIDADSVYYNKYSMTQPLTPLL